MAEGKKEKDLPLVEEFEYVRAVTSDGASVRVPKSSVGGGGGSDIGLATETTIGGFKAAAKTDEDTVEVKIDSTTGKAYVKPTGSSEGGVTGVKGNAESSYRQGEVNITPANIGLGNVDNTADSSKSVAYAASAGSATRATQDGSGNVITTTYATKEEVSAAESDAQDALDVANTAKSESSAAVSTSNEAMAVANTAKNAVATLEGLADTTTAQETLAAQVTQIEENKQNIQAINDGLKVVVATIETSPSKASTRPFIGAKLLAGIRYTVVITFNSPTGKFAHLRAHTASSGTATDTLLSNVYLNSGSRTVEYTPTKDVSYWYLEMASDYVKTDTTLISITAYTPSINAMNIKLFDVTSAGSFSDVLKDEIMPDSVVSESELFDTVVVGGKNLCNPDEINAGYYMNLNGEAKTNSSYSITGYIPIYEGQSLVCNSSAVSTSAYHAWYNSSYELIDVVVGTKYGQSLEWIDGAAYVRFTTFNSKTAELGGVQVELGTSSTAFEEYVPTTTTQKIKEKYIPNIGSTSSFEAFQDSATLSSGSVLTLASNHVRKNAMVSANIKGTITSVSFGLGYLNSSSAQYRDYDSVWIDLTSTEVKVYKSYSGDYQLKNTYTHGVTLTSSTTVEIDISIEKGVTESKFRLFNDLGGFFEQTITDGVGRPFIVNNGSSSLDVKLSFFSRDLVRKIWCFGDSYFSFSDSSRWPYYLTRYGFENWLSNNQPGLKPQLASTELKNLLSSGWKPVYVFWCLGMNGDTTESTDSEGNYVINSYQKTYIDEVVALCEDKGITLVLATIPTVPERQKTGFNAYVKSLGVRYVDFADAVGAQTDGTWNEGLLSSDEVHPSVAGGKVLASRVLTDFPEISIVE